jgi:hypothetical protein
VPECPLHLTPFRVFFTVVAFLRLAEDLDHLDGNWQYLRQATAITAKPAS